MAETELLVRAHSRRMRGIITVVCMVFLAGCSFNEIANIRILLEGDDLQMTMDGLYEAEKITESGSTPKVPVLIVPHHLTAAITIAAGIQSLIAENPASILLLSPDHFNKCLNILCTGSAQFENPLGETSFDERIMRTLKDSSLVSSDVELFRREHGITAVIPFIAKLLPDAKVTPIVISTSPAWRGRKNELLDLFKKITKEDVTLVVSSDFSHYLPLKPSDEADERTAEALFSKNYEAIETLDNPSQSDCPACLWLAANIADERNAYNPSVLLHTNSARLLNDESVKETTSHFAIAFYKNAELSSSDIMIGGDVTLTRGGNSSNIPREAFGFWQGNGPRIVNLEGPIRRECEPHANPYIFCNPFSAWHDIKDLATHWATENNHMLDIGTEGYDETRKLLTLSKEGNLNEQGTIVNDLKIYALTNVMNPVDAAEEFDLRGQYDHVISSLRKNDERIPQIVYVHAGTEYQSLSSSQEIAYLRSFVDAGADAVIAVHTHVPGDMEIYHDAPIFHGLGNLLFDQKNDVATRTAKMIRLRASEEEMLFETLITR